MRMNTEINADGNENPPAMLAPPDLDTKIAVDCSPSVKQKTVVMKRRNTRRWRWKCFTRPLQPISETVENVKDVTGDEYEKQCTQEIDGCVYRTNEKLLLDMEQTKNIQNQETLVCAQQNNVKAVISQDSTLPLGKEDYSACNKLIEKFQEAVIDTAVRIIQAYFKRFCERKRFLRLKKAVSVIQRNLRNWLQRRKSTRKSQTQSSKVCKSELEACVESSNSLQTLAPNSEIICDDSIIQSTESTSSPSCDGNSEWESLSETDDSVDTDDDDDWDAVTCVCMICGGWGCSPIVSTSKDDGQRDKHILKGVHVSVGTS